MDDPAFKALEQLEGAVGFYRMKHDLKGDGHTETGIAWDRMKLAQQRAREVLSFRRDRKPMPQSPHSADFRPEKRHREIMDALTAILLFQFFIFVMLVLAIIIMTDFGG